MKKYTFHDFIPVLAVIGLIGYGVFYLTGHHSWANYWILVFLTIGTLPLIWDMLKELWARNFGVDVIAIIAIVSSVLLGQYLAGGVVLLMLSGGEALESYAMRRARNSLTELLSHAPLIAHVKQGEKIIDQRGDLR